MLNTKKLLYILPDAAYIAEVLPTKKAHTFSIHSFRQINGSFIDENEFIVDNVKKLIHKIDPDEYHLILPDFLFTNTIVDIKETKESAVKEYLKETLLPSLELTKDTHEIDTFILTQHGGKSKVQLSALEQSLLEPIRQAAAGQQLTITQISPLSWTIKSMISLEPSLSTVQMGEMLYLALHYIGVDQTISFPISETANIIETVKTLKGAEPNIQTMYLLTNEVVEQQIKEQLSGTLPIQQLTNLTDETEGIPSFIKHIILAGARTLDLPELGIPHFSLGESDQKLPTSKSVVSAQSAKKVQSSAGADLPIIGGETVDELTDLTSSLPMPQLPRPTSAPVPSHVPEVAHLPKLPLASILSNPAELATEELLSNTQDELKISNVNRPIPKSLSLDDLEDEMDEEISKPVAETGEVIESDPFKLEETPDQENDENEEAEEIKLVSIQASSPTSIKSPLADQQGKPNFNLSPNKIPTAPKPELVPVAPIMIPSSYLTEVAEKTSFKPDMNSEKTEEPVTNLSSADSAKSAVQSTTSARKVIKNNNDAGALLKIILITLGALITTVVVGVGIGYVLLKYSEKTTTSSATLSSPTPVAVATPTPTPTPTASPAATLTTAQKAKFKILVVNATGVAGKAGKTKTSLTTAGYKLVTTGNAKSTYAIAGNYLLIQPANAGDLATLTTDSSLSLTMGTASDLALEDPQGAYDAVIVVNQ